MEGPSTGRRIFWSLAATAGAVGIGAVLYSLLKPAQAGASRSGMPRETLLAVLRDLQRQMLPLLSELAQMAAQLRIHAKGQVPDEQLEAYLLQHGPFKRKMEQLEAMVYRKHGVSARAVEKATARQEDDVEVASLTSYMRNTFQEALKGVQPSAPATAAPAGLTADAALEIWAEVLETVRDRLERVAQQLRAEGKTPTHPSFAERLGLVDIDEIKSEVLARSQIDSVAGFQLALSQFRLGDRAFTERFQAVTEEHERRLKAIVTPSDEDERAALKAVKRVNSDEEFTNCMGALELEDKLVVVEWWAKWALPCQVAGEQVADMSEEYPDVQFLRVNIDLARAVAQEAKVNVMPTFHLYRRGLLLTAVEGADVKALRRQVDAHRSPAIAL